MSQEQLNPSKRNNKTNPGDYCEINKSLNHTRLPKYYPSGWLCRSKIISNDQIVDKMSRKWHILYTDSRQNFMNQFAL